jgi:hypothetical protein
VEAVIGRSLTSVEVAIQKEYRSWRRPIRTYFRRTTEGSRLVGLDQLPDGTAS